MAWCRSWFTGTLLLTLLAAAACGDEGPSSPLDAGPPDAAEVEDLTWSADADPEELTECTSAPPPPGDARAKHVSCAEELLGGTVAMGRIGPDVVLENAVARFIVRGPDGAASLLGLGGGGLVDAALHGKPDLLKDVVPFTGTSSARASELVVTRASGASVAARALFDVEVVGLLSAVLPGVRPHRVHGVIDYELRADQPVLHVTVRLTTVDGVAAESFPSGFVTLIGGAGELVQPEGRGPQAVLEGPGSATALRMDGDGDLSEIQSITFLEGDELVARRGEEVTYRLRVAVGETAAAAWNALGEEDDGTAPLELRGTPGDAVEVLDADGAVVFRTRIDSDGTSVVRLPAASYGVLAGFGRWMVGAPVEVDVPAGGTSIDLVAAPRGILAVDLTSEGTDGTPEAAPLRVTITQGGEERARLVAIGPTEIPLPPGDYLVTVSRGPEHDQLQRVVTIADGGRVAIEGETLPRVVDTAGWVAGDFHLHSEMSTDSRHWLHEALPIVAAEGLEVVAATDHDFVTDYERHAAAAGVDGWVLFVPGAEVSHPLIAHVNGYPLRPDAALTANGAPSWFLSSPADWFDAIRAIGDTDLDAAGALVQINHPRRSSSGLFESIDLDRATGTARVSPMELGLDPATDLDDFSVDGIEVWNKSPDGDDEESLLDYLSLYSLDRRFAMMGNSDTHDGGRPAGSVRTYLAVPDDARGAFDWEDVATAIRERRATVSAGIFVTAEVAAHDASADTVDLAVRVQAPPYVAVERLRVYAGTEVTYDQPLASPGHITLSAVPLSGASFVAVRVDGGRGDPVVSHQTLGMTNPIELP